MDFSERLSLCKEAGLLDEQDIRDIMTVIQLFKNQYGLELREENADFFMAHLCAAYTRSKTQQTVEPLSQEISAQIEKLSTYEQSCQILRDIQNSTSNPLSETEQKYMLLHINNLLKNMRD